MFLLFNTTLGPELCVKLGEKKIPSGKKGPIFFSSPKLSVGPAGAGNCGVPGISCCGTTDSTAPCWMGQNGFLPFFFPTSVARLCGSRACACREVSQSRLSVLQSSLCHCPQVLLDLLLMPCSEHMAPRDGGSYPPTSSIIPASYWHFQARITPVSCFTCCCV